MTVLRVCGSCGQPLRASRLDVWFPKIKARIIDALRYAGETSLTSHELCGAVYPLDQQRSPQCIKSHIWQINEELDLEQSPWRIVAEGRGAFARWRLRRSMARKQTWAPL